jgi:hypothetical protein
LGSVSISEIGVLSLHVYYTSNIPDHRDILSGVHEDLLNSLGTTPPQNYKRQLTSGLVRYFVLFLSPSGSKISPPSPDTQLKLSRDESLRKGRNIATGSGTYNSGRVETGYVRSSFDKRSSLQTSIGSIPQQPIHTPPSLGNLKTLTR